MFPFYALFHCQGYRLICAILCNVFSSDGAFMFYFLVLSMRTHNNKEIMKKQKSHLNASQRQKSSQRNWHQSIKSSRENRTSVESVGRNEIDLNKKRFIALHFAIQFLALASHLSRRLFDAISFRFVNVSFFFVLSALHSLLFCRWLSFRTFLLLLFLSFCCRCTNACLLELKNAFLLLSIHHRVEWFGFFFRSLPFCIENYTRNANGSPKTKKI